MKKILLSLAASFALVGALLAHDITLVWTPSPDAGVTGYKIYYGLSTGALTNTWGVGLTNIATITGLTSATNWVYGFTVVATNATTESAPTMQIQTTIPPHSVKNPRIVGVTPNGFTFTWQPSDEVDAKTYKVTYGTVSPMTTNVATVAAPSTYIVITNSVVANANHYFDFTVLNNAGVESWPKTQLRAVLLPTGPADLKVTVQVQ
jgi:hypothetical protein